MTPSPSSLDRPSNARTLLADRVLTIAGQNAAELAPIIQPTNGGLVVTGKKVREIVARVRPMLGEAPLLIEPKAFLDHYATPSDPFNLNEEGQLFGTPLGDLLDAQIRAGASLAITPTGFMAAGDAGPLKAAVDQANMLDRSDTLLLMPIDTRWCKEPAAQQLVAILKGARHPIALALTGTGQNPWAEKGVLATLRRLCDEVPGLVLWRCDLTALDGMAHGAAAGAVGSLASLRRAFKPGESGFKTDVTDQSPHVLVGDLLRFARGRFMHLRWFANYPGIACTCGVCLGRALDRFTEPEMASEAARHNLHTLNLLASDMPDGFVARQEWWANLVEAAVHRHDELSAATKVAISPPADLTGWRRRAIVAGRTPATAGRSFR